MLRSILQYAVAIALPILIGEVMPGVHSLVQRHSGSAVARIELERTAQSPRLSIKDEGRGITPELRGEMNALRSAGVGLAGIEQRAQELGGMMAVISNERGTIIDITLPLPEHERATIANPAG
jgi:signal transduction histidine kinase